MKASVRALRQERGHGARLQSTDRCEAMVLTRDAGLGRESKLSREPG